MKLSNIAAAAGRRSSTSMPDAADIITFIESPWGLNLRLYPVQRVLLKAHYGLALDDNAQGFDLTQPIPLDHPDYSPDLVDEDGCYKYRIVATDWRRQNEKFLTEAGYLRFLFDDGRCNIREVTPGHERREMVLSVGRRSGKCVTGETLVLTDKGIFPMVQLGDPNGTELQPVSFDVAAEGAVVRKAATFFYNGGVKPTYKIRSQFGYGIEGTGNHRVRVLSTEGRIEWAYLDSIQPGDRLAVHRGTNLWASDYVDVTPHHVERTWKDITLPTVFDEQLGYIMGMLVGSNKQSRHDKMVVKTKDLVLRMLAHRVFDDCFGASKFQLVANKIRDTDAGLVTFRSVAYRRFLHRLGWTETKGSKEHLSAVPWVVLRSPVSVVRSFLKGFFDVAGDVAGDGADKGRVSLKSPSPGVLRDVQLLLLNLGIVSRRGLHLFITGVRSRSLFAEHIGFSDPEKHARLAIGSRPVIDFQVTRFDKSVDEPPYLYSLIARAYQSTRKNEGVLPGVSRSLRALVGRVSRSGTCAYSRISKILDITRVLDGDPDPIAVLQEIIDADYFFDLVESTSQSTAPVYDLHVPDGHMFVANGLTNHNTLLTACIIAYETYCLLNKGNPQGHYGSSQSNVIQLISVATDKDQAGLLYREASGHFHQCDYFKPYMANFTQTFATFQTPFDIERYGSYTDNAKARFSINVTFRSCVAKGLRGGANILVALDEVAHFTDEGQSSADDVYQAVEPSTRTFSPKDPKNPSRPIGENEGRIILISSPLGKQGLFYKQFSLGFTSGIASKNMLCVQAPTWEVNPTVPAGTFEGSYLKDPRIFYTEFGAVFTDRTRGWIETDSDLLACIDPKLIMKTSAPSRMPHFMGVDIALVGDYTAAAVGHIAPGGIIVLDYIDRIKAGRGRYTDADRLDFDNVADWIADIARRFYITEGIFDQWSGIPMEQALQKRGLSQLKSVHHTKPLVSQMWQNFKNTILDRKVSLYSEPNGDLSAYLQELLELQADYESKYVVKVSAPAIDGKHDDYSDALARMVWIASKNLSNSAVIFGNTTGANANSSRFQGANVSALQKAKRSGSHESRTIPRLLGRGRWR